MLSLLLYSQELSVKSVVPVLSPKCPGKDLYNVVTASCHQLLCTKASRLGVSPTAALWKEHCGEPKCKRLPRFVL